MAEGWGLTAKMIYAKKKQQTKNITLKKKDEKIISLFEKLKFVRVNNNHSEDVK